MSVEFIEKYAQRKIKPQKNETKEDCVRKLSHLFLSDRNIQNIVSSS